MICSFKGFFKGLIVLDKMFDRNAVTVGCQVDLEQGFVWEQ